jgi:hypothetical protein
MKTFGKAEETTLTWQGRILELGQSCLEKKKHGFDVLIQLALNQKNANLCD